MARPKDVTTTLNYHLPASQGGADALYLGTAGEKRRKHAQVPVKVLDVRAYPKEDFGLDTTGFEIVNRGSPEKKYDDDSKITSTYYNDCMDLIKNVTGATKVLPLGHLIRKMSVATALENDKDLDDGARSVASTPANFVHIDQSYDGAVHRFSAKFPDELEQARHKRWAIINVWRPLAPVTRSPLGVCDARSIPESDLVEFPAVSPVAGSIHGNGANSLLKGSQDPHESNKGRTFGTWAIMPPTNIEHKWYWCSSMQPEEAFLLKIFDSKKTGVARRTPHTAFTSSEDHGPDRQSLEARFFVIWEDQSSD